MPDLRNIRALVFDVFGTVVDWRSGIARAVADVARVDGHPLQASTAFADSWRARYQPALEEVRSGRRPFVILDVLHREMLLETLAEYRCDPMGDESIARLVAAWHDLPPWPDAVEGLARLATRYETAPLSNGHVALLLNLSRRRGLEWSLILGAEIAQAYKPDARVYDSAPRLLGIKPDECMMVACHPADLRAAAGRGLRTAYVHRPREKGYTTEIPRPPPGTFDLQVDSFTELAESLGV